jgi:hypothetical protein
MLHYFLTGDELLRETVIGQAQFVLDLDDGRKSAYRWLDRGDTGWAIQSASGYFGPGRGPANSLNALIDGHRLTGDPRFQAKADQLVRRVIHPAQDIGSLRLDVPEQRWFYTMFLQALGRYLHDRVERGLTDDRYAYAQASLMRFAEWMASHEHPYFDKPERLEFKTETWPAQDIRKADVFAYAALHSSPEKRKTLEERAQFFYEYSLKTLATLPTRALTRPVCILLGSGAVCDWVLHHPEISEPPGSAVSDFGSPERFVPQKVKALRNLKWMIAAGLLAVTSLLVATFLRLQ